MKTHFLFYGDSQLNEERTLHYYLKKSLSRLTLELKVLDMLVFIKTLTGKTLSINFKWEDTVGRVKEYIQDKEGRIYPDRHALSLAGDQLEDSRTMVSYNISNGTYCHFGTNFFLFFTVFYS